MYLGAWGVFVCLVLISCQFLFTISSHAQAWLPPKGIGTVSLAYKNFYVTDHTDKDGKAFDLGEIRHHHLDMDVEYGVTNRLALNLTVPLSFGNYTGTAPHRDPAGHLEFLDDGTYHGGFQDFRLGGRFNLVRYTPVVITAFIEGIIPSHDYVTFAHAALGRNLRELLIGTYVGRDLEELLPNAYFQTRVSFAFVERVLDTSHNRTNISGELGYGLTDRLVLSGVASFQKHHGGIRWNSSVPIPEQWTPDQLLHHDQLLRADSLDVGGGASFAVNRSTSVFANLLTTTWHRNGHPLQYGITIGISKSFSTRARPGLALDPAQP